MNTKALIAEFIGTMGLIIVGGGAGIAAGAGSGSLATVAFAHGITVLMFAYAFGHISGTHINPAVTLGALLSGAIDAAGAVGYWVAQILGGIVGALILTICIGGLGADWSLNSANTMGALHAAGNGVGALFAEAVMTFLFFTVIYQTAVKGKAGDFAGIAIGLALAGIIMWGGPITGASLNPARTLGPAIISGDFGGVLSGVVGPLVGAALAAVVNKALLTD